ncbi:MAG TPA: family 43 glycosylhydrolase, partial [Vicinamibacterales bacterium]|nr:family 43 glycosylhydrolase [Vicinamibacterales bacterium]
MNSVNIVPFLAVVLAVQLSSAAQDTAALPQPVAIDAASTHVYKSIGGVDLRLHIFNPTNHAATAAAPAIVFFFGGGWTAGTVNQFVPQAKHFASRGMVAIVADYRVFNRHKTTPFEAIADGKSAIRWVRARAKELGIDPNRIAAAGGSSGGHVALSAAVIGQFDEAAEDTRVSSRPNALVLFNPAVDTTPESEAARSGGRGSEAFKNRFGERRYEGSPRHHLRAGLVPTLILHGTADATIPYADVERFCALARKNGDRCELVGYEGAAHGFFNPQRDDGKGYRETLAEADRFLGTLGYVKPDPPSGPLKTSGNPIIPGWYADPEAHVFAGKYWIYPTYSAPYDQQTFMDAFSSEDLITWTKHPRILDAANVKWATRAMWAPSIVEKDGWYYLFFGANDIQNDSQPGGIGVARARRPEGPFEDYLGRPLIDKFHNGAQPIDQFVFKDRNGAWYIVYGGWRHCNIARLNDDFTGFVPFPDGTTFREITPKGYVEGAYMLIKDGKYYFMWSEGG